MCKLVYNEDLICEGFYKESIHKIIPSSHINIDPELKAYLIQLGSCKIKKDSNLQKPLYTYSDIEMFEKVIIDYEKPEATHSEIVEEQNAQLLIDNASKDSQIADLIEGQANALLDSASKDFKIEKLNKTVSELVLTIAQGGK
ncbi:hypothetical protein GKD14_02175 [Paeniclostridium sordellii]|nr:hypothetical protein [Paeniclostridium sordellii]MSB57734.1 hypothetical protein [Paeniclostridium sordellii]